MGRGVDEQVTGVPSRGGVRNKWVSGIVCPGGQVPWAGGASLDRSTVAPLMDRQTVAPEEFQRVPNLSVVGYEA